jgi:hypothetical protein
MAHLKGFCKQLLQLAIITFLHFTGNFSSAEEKDFDGIVK